jgi:hypothetical protein
VSPSKLPRIVKSKLVLANVLTDEIETLYKESDQQGLNSDVSLSDSKVSCSFRCSVNTIAWALPMPCFKIVPYCRNSQKMFMIGYYNLLMSLLSFVHFSWFLDLFSIFVKFSFFLFKLCLRIPVVVLKVCLVLTEHRKEQLTLLSDRETSLFKMHLITLKKYIMITNISCSCLCLINILFNARKVWLCSFDHH